MDVANQRNVDAAFNFSHGPGGILIRHGHTDDLTPGLLQAEDLAHRGRHILSRRVAHGLYAHGRAAAYGHAAHLNLLAHILIRSFLPHEKRQPKKPRRVRIRRCEKFKSFFTATCAWGKIPLRLPVWNFELSSKLCAQQTAIPLAEKTKFFRQLLEYFPHILKRHRQHQQHQQRKARNVDIALKLLRDALADHQHAQGVDDQEEDFPPVQRR